MFARVLPWLSSRGPGTFAVFAAVLSLPALTLGFQLDDHLLRAGALSPEKLPLWDVPEPLLAEQKQRGFWAWWASPGLVIQFFRPLSWWTHRLDFLLWRDNPVPMATLNVLLYAALVWTAAWLYRRFVPNSEVAVVAAAMYAVNDAHANTVGWIACRNSLLAALFSLGALALHVRARQERRPWLQAGSLALVALALLSGEGGIVSLAYLFAYALVFESGALPTRVKSIVPQLVLGAAWLSFYVGSGFGLKGTTWYRDPAGPWNALSQGFGDLPLWTVDLFGLNVLNLALLVPPYVARLAALPLALVVLWLVVPRIRDSKPMQFFALATAFALAPLLLTTPQDRLTINASFGAFGWLAGFIASARTSPRAWLRVAGGALLVVNLWVSLLSFPLQLGSVRPVERGLQTLARATPRNFDQVILVNSPFEIIENEVPFVIGMDRRLPGAPESLHRLYSGGAPVEILRIDARTLDVTVREGWGRKPIGRIFCARGDLPKLHERRQVDGMSIQVRAVTSDGLPSVVRFEFATPLEAASRAWLVWRGSDVLRWSPPPIGARASIAATPLLEALPL